MISGYGNGAHCAAHTEDRCDVIWSWAWGANWPIANFYEIPDEAGSKPNLKECIPELWDGPLVVSSEMGTHTQGPDLVENIPCYID